MEAAITVLGDIQREIDSSCYSEGGGGLRLIIGKFHQFALFVKTTGLYSVLVNNVSRCLIIMLENFHLRSEVCNYLK